MKNDNSNTKPKASITSQLVVVLAIARRYAVIAFVVLLVGVYGFVSYRIQAAHDAEPTQEDVDSQIQATAALHIDPSVVEQMESLRDNSVNVQTLFEQARNNPFHE